MCYGDCRNIVAGRQPQCILPTKAVANNVDSTSDLVLLVTVLLLDGIQGVFDDWYGVFRRVASNPHVCTASR